MKGLAPDRRARFESYASYLEANEPRLSLQFDHPASLATITGELVVDVGAGVMESFELCFEFPGADPFAMPDVWDRVGRFPADIERHILEVGERGSWWCLGLPQAPPVDFKADMPLHPFFFEVRGFILKQLIFDDRRRAGRPDPWPGPAWGHGLEGHVEWIEQQLGPTNVDQLRGLVPYLLDAPLAGNHSCPCGSGTKASACHRKAVELVSDAARHSPARSSIRKAIQLLAHSKGALR